MQEQGSSEADGLVRRATSRGTPAAAALGRARRLGGHFRRSVAGQISIIFAFASMALVVGVGSGVDLSRAYLARQKLSQVATLTCQFSTRASVVDLANTTSGNSGGFQTYLTAVNSFATTSLNAQNWNTTNPTGTGNGTANYFTATAPSGADTSSGTAPTNGVTDISASYPTTFLQIINVTQIPLHARVACQTANGTPPGHDNPYILQEGFETGVVGYSFTLPSGANGTTTMPKSTFPSSPGYTGSGGTQWYIMGYCLEIDSAGVISASDPEGTHSAELDCDNGSGSAGNSSISSKVYLPNGYYEIRYNYRSRIDYPNYDPTYVCGSTASDVSWANDTGNSNSARTNQLNVYLDMNTTGSAPLHTTIDGSQQLAGANLIDMCVYSNPWIERSIKFKVTTPAYYWLSFAADGGNDSYGGQLDNIRVCPEVCPTSLQDNFPTTWLAANNAGVNKVLFEDTFDLPAYTSNTSYNTATNGNLNSSTGTSGASSGWPSQSSTGWATAPYNQVTYGTLGAAQGAQYITLDGYNSNGSALTNRLISRPFVLDPGYYQVAYRYLAMVNFYQPSYAVYCLSAPASGNIFPIIANWTGRIRYYPNSTTYSGSVDTNIMGVYMSHSLLVSTPVAGNAQGSLTSYTNPNGTVTTTPTNPPDAMNTQSYNAAAANPLLDFCAYTDNWTWTTRTVSIKITKPGTYWLTFSANGSTGDGSGAAIDDAKLTALGSPFMASPPTSPLVAIPVPAPQPDTNYTNSGAFDGFTIVANPFMPPAADQ